MSPEPELVTKGPEHGKPSFSQFTQVPGRSSQRILRALQVLQPDFEREPFKLCDGIIGVLLAMGRVDFLEVRMDRRLSVRKGPLAPPAPP